MESEYLIMLGVIKNSGMGTDIRHPKLTNDGVDFLKRNGLVEENPSTKRIFITPSGIKEFSKELES